MQAMPKINPADDDFGCVINCAIRYCLGRMTYMPGLVCDYVRPLLPYLNDKTIGCMERDILECENYGMDCDEATWMNLLAAIRQQMTERGISPWN